MSGYIIEFQCSSDHECQCQNRNCWMCHGHCYCPVEHVHNTVPLCSDCYKEATWTPEKKGDGK
jgi:hypothetical protein